MNKNLYGEGVRYLIAGLVTTIINIAIYKALLNLGSAYGIATTIAFIVSVLFAYYANGRHVFRSKLDFKGLIKFYSARLATFFGETAMLVFMIEGFEMDAFIAKLMVNVMVIIANYFISKFWIFKGDQHEKMDR